MADENAAEIKQWFLKEGAAFHAKARKYLSQFDKDLNPNLFREKGGIMVALGTFSNVRISEEKLT